MEQLVMRVFAAAAVAAVVALPVNAQQADQVATPAQPAAPASAQAEAKVLAEGDPAPSLNGIAWLKGEPVKKFEAGRIYIVEIWATWCGPCKKSIPHLTELQAKHKDKLTVIGISCWERAEEATTRVSVARSFVESQGAAMEYTCAADGGGVIVRDWMQPAGRRSIPTAFIVDGKGNIAWIGNPLSGMDAVLDRVLAGNFDAKVEAEKARAAAAVKKVKDEKFARANLLANSGEYGEALKLLDEMLAAETDAAARVPVIRQKFRMMLAVDEPAAYVYARSLLDGELKGNDYALYLLAESITKMMDLEKPDRQLVIDLLTRSTELALPTNATVREALAAAKFQAGDVPGAIAAAEQAMEAMKDPASKANAASIARVQKVLEEYRAAQK